MIQVKQGSIFQTNAPVLVHQVNCQGVMAAGLARQVKLAYPECYRVYCGRCELYRCGITHDLLGQIDEIRTEDDKTIINCYAQEYYGKDRRYTDYEALDACFEKIKHLGYKHIAMPYKIGCGLAGGSWSEVEPLIKKHFGGEDIICELWKLPENSSWNNY